MRTSGGVREGSLRAAKVDFLRTELKLGRTFAHIATASADDAGKRERNAANALKSYITVQAFRPRILLTAEEAVELDAGLSELRRELVALGVV